jgi:protein involved in polysaccharide export with SLBB domain
LALVITGGCETKSFVDPSELTSIKRDPLVLPIVSQVDPVLEGSDNQWTRAGEPTADDLKPTTSDYHITSNDLLAITLSDINGPNTETVKQTRVTESGYIGLPYLEPIRAAGLTEIQLEQKIIQAYKDANLIQHAQVSVTVIEARGRAFKILGASAGIGEYAIVESDFRLLDALVLSHGVTSNYVDYIYVVRHNDELATTQPAAPVPATGTPHTAPPTTGPSNEELLPKSQANPSADSATIASAADHVFRLAAAAPEAAPAPAPAMAPPAPTTFDGFRDPSAEEDIHIIRVPYAGLKAGVLRYNIPIRPRDLIFIADPVTGFYYMGGHVARPGAYTLTGQKITIKDAIISTGMLDGLAIPERAEVIRYVHPGHEVFLRIDVAKIFSGESPDIYLKPEDKVMVGTNMIAPFLAALRGGFRISYGFGFLIDRNYAYTNSGQAAF